MESTSLNNVQQIIDADVPNIYFNGFAILTSEHDIIISLQRNGKPVAVLNTPHSMAKTLASALSESTTNFEEKMNTTIPIGQQQVEDTLMDNSDD